MDGSIIDLTLPSCKMGLGWVQTHNASPPIEFQAAAIINPSSSKAESLAILTALLTSPTHCHVQIYTDSQNSIDNFHKVSTITRYHRKLKIKNLTIWQAITNIIKELSLKVSLFKVKGHNNDPLNDKADELAKLHHHI